MPNDPDLPPDRPVLVGQEHGMSSRKRAALAGVSLPAQQLGPEQVAAQEPKPDPDRVPEPRAAAGWTDDNTDRLQRLAVSGNIVVLLLSVPILTFVWISRLVRRIIHGCFRGTGRGR